MRNPTLRFDRNAVCPSMEGRPNVKGREAAIALTGRYTTTWHDYSVLSGLRNGTFRQLWTEVDTEDSA